MYDHDGYWQLSCNIGFWYHRSAGLIEDLYMTPLLWSELGPPDIHVGALVPEVTVFADGAIRRC